MSGNGIRSPYRFSPGAIPFRLIVAAFISPAIANSGSPIPDLSGQWGRDMLFFEPPPSGPGPVSRAERKSDGSVCAGHMLYNCAPTVAWRS